MYSLFNLNPSDYELQTKETGVSADQYSDARDSLKISHLNSRLALLRNKCCSVM